jgi:hypothetical protein
VNYDRIATVVGTVAGGLIGAPAAVNVAHGSMTTADYFQLGSAVAVAILGFFTNRQKKVVTTP